jgi:hypothetical protein
LLDEFLMLHLFHTVTYWAVSRKRVGKHIPKSSRIGAHCYATVLVLWFTARSVTLTVESRYPRQRIVQSTAAEGREKINCWERCRIFGRLKCYVRDRSQAQKSSPCGGGVEYLHRDPASRRRRRKGKSRIWDSKIWPRVLRESDPKMTALARANSNCKRQTRPLVRESAPNQQTRNSQTIIKIWS